MQQSHSFLKGRPAIFEIKRINEENENHEVRAAVSQLYEYSFTHTLANATLWMVFSEKPYSRWLIEYLETDRDIRALWIENNQIAGTSKA